MKKSFSTFMNESAAEKRSLARSLSRKLPDGFSYGGTMNLVAMADEDVMSVADVAKATKTISGVGDFKKPSFGDGLRATYGSGAISVFVSSGKVRVEFS